MDRLRQPAGSRHKRPSFTGLPQCLTNIAAFQQLVNKARELQPGLTDQNEKTIIGKILQVDFLMRQSHLSLPVAVRIAFGEPVAKKVINDLRSIMLTTSSGAAAAAAPPAQPLPKEYFMSLVECVFTDEKLFHEIASKAREIFDNFEELRVFPLPEQQQIQLIIEIDNDLRTSHFKNQIQRLGGDRASLKNVLQKLGYRI